MLEEVEQEGGFFGGMEQEGGFLGGVEQEGECLVGLSQRGNAWSAKLAISIAIYTTFYIIFQVTLCIK